jgi:hypothetical protein
MKLIEPKDIERFKDFKEFLDLKVWYGTGCKEIEKDIYSVSLPVILVFYKTGKRIICEAVTIPKQEKEIVKDPSFVTFVYKKDRYISIPKVK